MTRVLPLPAPATISSGPSTWATASRWGSVRSCNNRSTSITRTTPDEREPGRTGHYSRAPMGRRHGTACRARRNKKGQPVRAALPVKINEWSLFPRAVRLELAEELVEGRRGVVAGVVALVQQGEALAPSGTGELLQ